MTQGNFRHQHVDQNLPGLNIKLLQNGQNPFIVPAAGLENKGIVGFIRNDFNGAGKVNISSGGACNRRPDNGLLGLGRRGCLLLGRRGPLRPQASTGGAGRT